MPESRRTDPKQVRLNDETDPDRAQKFQDAMTRIAGSGNAVFRGLVDALLRYVDEHGHGPTFPVDIIPRSPSPKPKAKK